MPRLQVNSRNLINNIFAASKQADETWTRDRNAAMKIQSTVRMFNQRRSFHRLQKYVIALQRIYRGYRGRLYVLEQQIANAENRRAQIFHCHARNIQRIFRGYICRKYTNDFCAQKAYISRIAQTSESIRKAGIDARAQQEKYLAGEQIEVLRNDFAAAAKNKHHLLSTAVCPGVFRTPLEPEGTKTLFGTDVEDEIRSIPMDPQEIKIRRSKFLRDVIPVENNNNNNVSNKFANTSRTAANNSNDNSDQASRTSKNLAASVSSAKKSAGARMTIAQEPYKRSLASESDYDRTGDQTLSRKVEEKIVSSVHGNKAGSSYFHVPANAVNNVGASGFVAKIKR